MYSRSLLPWRRTYNFKMFVDIVIPGFMPWLVEVCPLHHGTRLFAWGVIVLEALYLRICTML